MPISASTLSVVIPTYQRPSWLKRAVEALAQQNRLPDEVIVIARDTDGPTHDAFAELEQAGTGLKLRKGVVTEAGFMPPVKLGFELAEGDIIAVHDDDADALPNWAERLLSHYADPKVGAVGGRVINVYDDVVQEIDTTNRVGYVSRFGVFIGDMYKRPTFPGPVEVRFMMGGNSSFRREIAHKLEFDWDLNRCVATHYEVDLGLQVHNLGYKIIFDPRAAIRHHSAPRSIAGNRVPTDFEAVRWSSYNELRIALRRLPISQSASFVARGFTIGTRRAPGLIPLIMGPIARKAGFITSIAPAAIQGRASAIARIALDAARSA